MSDSISDSTMQRPVMSYNVKCDKLLPSIMTSVVAGLGYMAMSSMSISCLLAGSPTEYAILNPPARLLPLLVNITNTLSASKLIGSGIVSPENLAYNRPFLIILTKSFPYSVSSSKKTKLKFDVLLGLICQLQFVLLLYGQLLLPSEIVSTISVRLVNELQYLGIIGA